ncbi:MAG TPA: alpha/beta fold hydrolase [Thermoplasmata archaeon]|nr:alpha/beta fold hydrolase [Thermoplasmata archaeon]
MDRPNVAELRSSFTSPHELLRASDGRTLFLRRWDAGPGATVSVLIFHGITAYSGPYGPLIAESLARAGFNVFGMDLRGHGLSDGKRGDYPSVARWERDLCETVAFVKARAPRLVLLGHSLGVLSAIRAQQLRPADVNGLILLSAARKVRPGVLGSASGIQVLKALVAVGILRGTPLIGYRREGMIGLDDPLFNFRYSARFYTVLYGAGALRVARMFRSGDVDSPRLRFDGKLRIPLLVGVGDQDELFPSESVREFWQGIDCDAKEFLLIPNARHAVFPKDAWGPLIDWLRRAC